MTILKLGAACLMAILLAGCLEVEQHPEWVNGKYAGKRDDLHFQRNFHNDKLAWSAAILDRNQRQNEYNRSNP